MALNLGDALLHLQVLTVKGYMSKNNAALAKCVVIAVVSANMIGNWAMEKKKRYHKTLFHIGIISLVSLAVGRQLLDII